MINQNQFRLPYPLLAEDFADSPFSAQLAEEKGLVA